jgi:hypothetical protein
LGDLDPLPDDGLDGLVRDLLAGRHRDVVARLIDRSAGGPLPAGAEVVALGWGTVDLERAMAEVAELGGLRWAAAADPLLGARGLRAGLAPVDLVVLEPVTEGRLAAFLARNGEGCCALYLTSDGGVAGGPPRRDDGGGETGRDERPDLSPARPTAIGRTGRLWRTDRSADPSPGSAGRPYLITLDPR